MVLYMNNQFPDPSPETKDHSQKLIALIAEKISEHGGKISFAEYMQLALYTPGFGYYSAGLRKFGREGDFVTAPEISPLFSQCLAQQCQQVLSQMAKGSILEFGAGTGIMAADILNELERLNSLPEHYYILEISPELQQRQRETLARSAPQYAKRVTWLDQLPHDFRGIMLANEVLDAMPVERFHIESHEIQQYFVGFDRGQFYWQL
ncbi:MAG: SAM-dependent methyltransferase, partial [Proteobacteria bacterium]|nr:SAM-dependent methyltransferase [Pseudomonadota bacterium]